VNVTVHVPLPPVIVIVADAFPLPLQAPEALMATLRFELAPAAAVNVE